MTARKTVISNVRVFDGSGLTETRSVIIDGSLIGKTPDNAVEVVDGQGGILVPGLIDAHVHLHHEGHLQALARYGVTTALDMASWPAEKIDNLRDIPGTTDIRSAGLPATARGSLHSNMLSLPPEALLSSGGEDAKRFVAERIAEGSDYIKIICDIPGPSQSTLNAITSVAHQRGKIVVAHASTYAPFQMALASGADCITHVPRDKVADSDMVEEMAARKIFCVPTLTMMQETSKQPPLSAIFGLLLKPSLLTSIVKSRRNGAGKQTYVHAADSVTALYRAGVPILAGTDCHEESNSYFDVKHGSSLHRELALLVDAGLSTVDVLRAATVLPARHFGLNDRGVIEVGKRADLVLLRDDPVKDIRASMSISRVWCGGIEVDIK